MLKVLAKAEGLKSVSAFLIDHTYRPTAWELIPWNLGHASFSEIRPDIT